METTIMRRETEREREQEKEKGVKPNKNMCCTLQLLTAHWPPAQPVPQHSPATPGQLFSVYLLSIMFHGMEYAFGSAALAMLPPNFWYTCYLAKHGTLRIPWPRISSAEQQPKHQCVINNILILNPKYSTVSAKTKTHGKCISIMLV